MIVSIVVAVGAVFGTVLGLRRLAQHHQDSPVLDYATKREAVAKRVGPEAIEIMPREIPASARDSRVFADLAKKGNSAVLMLYYRTSPQDISEFVAAWQSRALELPVLWTVTNPGFMQPGWHDVMPGMKLGENLPKGYKVLLVYKKTISYGIDEINAGAAVNQETGEIVLWANRWCSEFN